MTYPMLTTDGNGVFSIITKSGRYPFTREAAARLLDTKATQTIILDEHLSVYLTTIEDIIIVNDDGKLFGAYRPFFVQFMNRQRSELMLRPMDESDLPWPEERSLNRHLAQKRE